VQIMKEDPKKEYPRAYTKGASQNDHWHIYHPFMKIESLND
jgi:hypothetical protein